MPTLWQILMDKIKGKPTKKADTPESKLYNPIEGLRRGCAITIDALDYRGKNFFVKGMRELSVSMSGKTFKMTDYVLQANLLSGETVDLRLRVVPEPNGKFGLPFRAMVLNCYDSLEYNEGLHNVVKDTSKKFVVDDSETGAHDEYWRVNDVGIAYPANVATLADGDEPTKSAIEYWDYSRLTKIDDVETEQFLFVEMNTDNGWFEIWRGAEINPEQVIVI